MEDLISRQAAIDMIEKYFNGLPIAVHYDMIAMIHRLPSAQPEPQWIPCKPINQYYIRELDDCKDKPYLVTYETKTGRRYVTKVNIYNGFVQKKENRIIAWMPLPEPYKEKDNERA